MQTCVIWLYNKIFTWCYCLTILRICNDYMWAEEEMYEFHKMALNLLLFQNNIYINDRPVYIVAFSLTPLWIKRPDNQSPEGLGLCCSDGESQCKNAKVNKEWLLLRNKQRERACKAGSVVQDRERTWASFSSAKAQRVCKDTCWRPGTASINRLPV